MTEQVQGPLRLAATAMDVAVASASAKVASETQQTALRNVTKLADENPMMVAAAAVWLGSRLSNDRGFRRNADHLLGAALVSTAVPHGLKRVFGRRRPDRSYLDQGNGIRKSGNAWDSFPSGHSVHVGAIARSAGRLAPPAARPFVWLALAALLPTRLLVLAHYPTDVLAGVGVGLVIDHAVEGALNKVTGG